MASSTEARLRLGDFTNRITLPLHGPNHWYRDLMVWDGGARDYFPMMSANMVLEFFLHGFDELLSIGLLESLVESHRVRVQRSHKSNNVLGEQCKGVWFAVRLYVGLY
jgi:hypothetical protein